MSKSSLAKGPLIAALVVAVAAGAMYLLPSFVAGLPWVESPYILIGGGAAAAVLLLLSLVLGRRAQGSAEPAVDFLAASQPPSTGNAGVAGQFDLPVAAAALMPPGLSAKEQKEWQKDERRRLAAEEKFRKDAEKEAKKAAKKAGKSAGGAAAGDYMDANSDEDWISQLQEASYSHLQGQQKQPEAVHNLLDIPTDQPAVVVGGDVAAFAPPVAKPLTPALPEEQPAPVQVQPSIQNAAAAMFAPPAPQPVPVAATETPMFREEEMSPEWMTAAYRDEEFAVPFAHLDPESGELPPPPDAIEELSDVSEVTHDDTPVLSDDEHSDADVEDSGQAGNMDLEDLPAPVETDQAAQEEDPDRLSEQANEMVARLADIVSQVDERADRAENAAATAREEADRARAELAQARQEIEDIRTGELAQAQHEVERLGRVLADAEADMDRVLDSQDSISSAAALTERTRIGVRLRRIRATLDKDPARAQAVIEQIDDLLAGTAASQGADDAEPSSL